MHWAATSGPATAQVVEAMRASRPPPQQGCRSCRGSRRLGKSDSAERLEAAGRRALTLGACAYKSLASSLKKGLDRQPWPPPPALLVRPSHPTVGPNMRLRREANPHAHAAYPRQTADAAPHGPGSGARGATPDAG